MELDRTEEMQSKKSHFEAVTDGNRSHGLSFTKSGLTAQENHSDPWGSHRSLPEILTC